MDLSDDLTSMHCLMLFYRGYIVRDFVFEPNVHPEVARILTNAHRSGVRLRLFFGDPQTGEDWMEEFGTVGTVGCTTGVPSPILVANKSCLGGSLISCEKVLKITCDKQVLWQASNYYLPQLFVIPTASGDFLVTKCNVKVPLLVFGSRHGADNYIAFLQGRRNVK